MIPFTGKYTTAKVMLDYLNDEKTIGQIVQFINHSAFTNRVAIMPDCHYGKGAVIGFTMELPDRVAPSVVGVDQDCGLEAVRLSDFDLQPHIDDFDRFDQAVRRAVPMGGGKVRKKPALNMERDFPWHKFHLDAKNFTWEFNKRYGVKMDLPYCDYEWFGQLCKRAGVDQRYAELSIGSLGSGNHFIEVGIDEGGHPWLTVHSGSRNLGARAAAYWQNVAIRDLKDKAHQANTVGVAGIKASFPKEEWEMRIKKLKDSCQFTSDLAYLQGEHMYSYLLDSVFFWWYAHISRKVMVEEIVKLLPAEVVRSITTVHNYIDYRDFIIRKGAISSYAGQKMAIPFNMEDGMLICEGKSNPNWNYSAPHGAGRVYSRTEAKKKLDNAVAAASMAEKGILSSVLPTDELKGAYKPAGIIEKAIEPTAKVLHRVKPVFNFKAK